MPNSTGVVLLKADRDYPLKFDMNALCELEDAFGTDLNGIVERLNSDAMSARDLRQVLFSTLKSGGGLPADATVEDAGKIAAPLQEQLRAIGEALQLALPSAPAQPDQKSRTPGKRKRAAGTTTNS